MKKTAASSKEGRGRGRKELQEQHLHQAEHGPQDGRRAQEGEGRAEKGGRPERAKLFRRGPRRRVRHLERGGTGAMTLLAAFVGVGKYDDSDVSDVPGAGNDATALWALLSDSVQDLDARLLLSEEATGERIRQ